MAKITRKTQKILGSNSSNTGIFGNAQKGIYDQFSQDPDVIQTPEWESGWNQATFSGAKIPPLEERQAVDLVVTRQIAYVLQEGIPEWDVGTEYHKNSIVKESGTTNLYYSITDNNIGNPLSDPLNWTQFSFGVSDGDYGDVTVSDAGQTITINEDAVTTDKINDGAVNTDKLGGDITAAGKALLDDADAEAQRNTLGIPQNFQPLSPRVQSVVSSGTVTPTSNDDIVIITAQAEELTIANPTGTMSQGQALIIRIKDDGTARVINYGSNYRAVGVILPDTTVINKTMYIAMIWNETDGKFDVTGVAQEA